MQISLGFYRSTVEYLLKYFSWNVCVMKSIYVSIRYLLKYFLWIFSCLVKMLIRLTYLNEYKVFAEMHEPRYILLYAMEELIAIFSIKDMLVLWQW